MSTEVMVSPYERDIVVLLLILDENYSELKLDDLNELREYIALSSHDSKDIAKNFNDWLDTHDSIEERYFSLTTQLQPATENRGDGSIDIAGIGTLAGHFKDLILALVDVIVNREKRKQENYGLYLDNQRKSEENRQLVIRNQKETLDMQSECFEILLHQGYSVEQIHAMISSHEPTTSEFVSLLRIRQRLL